MIDTHIFIIRQYCVSMLLSAYNISEQNNNIIIFLIYIHYTSISKFKPWKSNNNSTA